MSSSYRAACAVVLALLFGATLYPAVYSFNFPTAAFNQINYQRQGTLTGDTWTMGGWSKAADIAGSFGGGCLLTTANDTNNGAGHAIEVYKICNIDYATPGNTSITLLNNMTDFGGSAQINVGACQGGAGWSWHGDAVFIRNGVMYLSVSCSDTNTGNRGTTGLICSTDKGVHWTNYAHWTANSGSCLGATSSANGDVPANAAGSMQWPGGGITDATNKMAFLRPIQMCQDMTVSCPTPSWADPLYDYFFTWLGDTSAMYIARILKADNQAMDPTKWSCISVVPTTPTGTPTWTTNVANCAAIPNPMASAPYSTNLPYSMLWDGKRIIGVAKTGGLLSTWGAEYPVFETAVSPWYGWSIGAVVPANYGGWPGISLGTLSQINSNRQTVTVATNGSSTEYNLHFQQYDVQDSVPMTGLNGRAANPGCVQGTWRFSDVLIPGFFPSNGLQAFTDTYDSCGLTGSSAMKLATDVFTGAAWTCSAGTQGNGWINNPNCSSSTDASAADNGAWTMVVVPYINGTGVDTNAALQVNHVSGGYSQFGWRCGNYGGCTGANNQVYFRMFTNATGKYTDVLQTTGTITTSGAYHFYALAHPAGVLDGNTATMWVDGAKVPTSRGGDTGATTATMQAFTGMALFQTGGGNIAFGAFWNRVLTDQEMLCTPGPANCGVYKMVKARLATRGISLP